MSNPMCVDQQQSTCQIRRVNETIGSITDQTAEPTILPQDATLYAVSKALQHDREQLGVLIHIDQNSYLPIYRDRMFLDLARPFAKDLYAQRPVLNFIKRHHASTPLVLPADTTISAAIEAALQRPTETRYDPILVTLASDQPPRMVDVRSLLERQRNLLSNALSVVDQQRQEAHLAATHDRLTGLPNRQHAMARLTQMSRSQQNNSQHDYAVLFLDFDRFKLVNDSLGHDAGDELLIQISHRIKDTLHQFTGQPQPTNRWLAARLGGDEFLVLIDQLEQTGDAQTLAQQIIQAMRPAFDLRGYEVRSSPSIGIATCQSSDGTNPDAILRDADAAMYRAKAQGRARYILFDQSMQEESLERLHLESQLRKAVELNQFRAHYQPIVCCESGQVKGFEALVRWEHPDMGMVSPGKFIPIAEDCGVISAIGRFMLEEAINQLAQWNRTAPTGDALYMSINVSKRQLLKPGFTDHLQQILQQTAVPPSQVNLEITETTVSEHGDTIINTLQQCKELGVRLSMDDFGTGLSSLTHLHQYPVDVLKIDQAFVKHLEEKSIYTAVVLAIVTLAKNLNMSIVVEGIERIEQLAQIQALDCEYAQGYFFSRPVPADEAVKLIQPNTGYRRRSQVA